MIQYKIATNFLNRIATSSLELRDALECERMPGPVEDRFIRPIAHGAAEELPRTVCAAVQIDRVLEATRGAQSVNQLTDWSHT